MKNILRKQMLEKRKKMEKEAIAQKSSGIQKRLLASKDFRLSKNILIYIPINNEVLTDVIIRKAFSLGKKVALPIVHGNELKLSTFNSLNELAPGRFGVLEPKKEFIRPIKPEEIDLVVMPGIAFDEDGNRIGYGKGYYDKLLAKMKAKKIALAYDFQITKKILKEHNDIPMDIIMTEKRTGERT